MEGILPIVVGTKHGSPAENEVSAAEVQEAETNWNIPIIRVRHAGAASQVLRYTPVCCSYRTALLCRRARPRRCPRSPPPSTRSASSCGWPSTGAGRPTRPGYSRAGLHLT